MVHPTETDVAGLKRIRAGSYQEALDRIYAEFGGDVRIVHTRVVRREGLLGMVGSRGVEVYVATKEPARTSPATSAPDPERVNGSEASPGDLADLQKQVRRLMRRARNGSSRSRAGRPPVHAQLLLQALAESNGKADDAPDEASSTGAMLLAAHHPVVRSAGRLLSEQGFVPETSHEIVQRLRQRRVTGSMANETEARTLSRLHLGEIVRPKIPPCAPIAVNDVRTEAGPRLIACVGPTGVGKTTTLAKLSVPLKLVHGRSVGLVTLDTQRIGAVEQIRRYGTIVGLEVEPVERGQSLARAIARFQHCDVVFIDTPGFNPRSGPPLEELRQRFGELGDVEIHLCLGVNSSTDYLFEVAERFRPLAYDRLLLTKVDEAVKLGQVLDLLLRARVPVSYLTCGQHVPEDIQAATTERLESLLLGD